MKRVWLAALLLLAACAPLPGGGVRPFTYDDGWRAVDLAFADLGAGVLACAHTIAGRESNHAPYAQNGQFRGIFQEHPGFQGSWNRAAVELAQRGEAWHLPHPFDPYVSAWAARYAWEAAGQTFSVNWPTAPGGC